MKIEGRVTGALKKNMKQIAPDQNYILLIAPVRKGRTHQSVAEKKGETAC